jgi:hypothetical protein
MDTDPKKYPNLFNTALFQRVLTEIESKTKTRLSSYPDSGTLREEQVALWQQLRRDHDYLCKQLAIVDLVWKYDHEHERVYISICRLISAALMIGSNGVMSEEVMSFLRKSALARQATVAQQANIDIAAARKERLRAAIYQAANGGQLVGSLKFAESIHDGVTKSAGVDSDARGFSSRTIQREINSILEERRNS